MDAFEFVDDEEEEKKTRRLPSVNMGNSLWNLGTIAFLLGTVCIGAWFIAVFLNPTSSLNPFPSVPPTNTPEISPTPPPPTEFIPSATPTFLPTPGPAATETTEAQPTPTDEVILTPTPTDPSGSEFSYQIQDGNPIYLASIIFHPDLDCNFLGVGGQVIDSNTAPVQGYTVQLIGVLDGEPVDKTTLTGAATQFGPSGGYEHTIANAPFDSAQVWQVQLLDQQGLPLSEIIIFDTFDDCSRNLVLINFVEIP